MQSSEATVTLEIKEDTPVSPPTPAPTPIPDKTLVLWALIGFTKASAECYFFDTVASLLILALSITTLIYLFLHPYLTGAILLGGSYLTGVISSAYLAVWIVRGTIRNMFDYPPVLNSKQFTQQTVSERTSRGFLGLLISLMCLGYGFWYVKDPFPCLAMTGSYFSVCFLTYWVVRNYQIQSTCDKLSEEMGLAKRYSDCCECCECYS